METGYTKMPSTLPNAPVPAVGAVVFKNNRVLLVKRGKAPAKGEWAIPGGSVILGETLKQAAEREVYEETGIRITAGDPVYTFDAIHRNGNGDILFHYVIVDLSATYDSGEPKAGDDADNAKWVSEEDLKTMTVSKPTRDLLMEKYQFGIKKAQLNTN